MRSTPNPKRQAILDAAQRIFFAHGYKGASMEAIAEAAPVSKPTLYSHFKDKKELFAAVIQARCDALLDTLSNVQTAWEDPATGLKTIAGAFIDLIYAQESLELYRLSIAEQRHLPELGDVVYRASAMPIGQRLADYLSELNAQGVLHIPDPATSSQLFGGMLQGHQHFRCLMGLQPGLNPGEKEHLIEAAVTLFLKGHGYVA